MSWVLSKVQGCREANDDDLMFEWLLMFMLLLSVSLPFLKRGLQTGSVLREAA